MEKLEEAKKNIELVISNCKMTRQEHILLQQNIKLLYDNAIENMQSKESMKEVD